MFIYQQRTGRLLNRLGAHLYTGYSGHGEGKNNPAFQAVHNVGPIPQGDYVISKPFDSPDHGPYCLRLTPLIGTDTFGRSGFLMHGEKKPPALPGNASLGCVIMPRVIREAVSNSGDEILRVTE